MHQLGLNAVLERLEQALHTDDLNTASALLWPALDQAPELGVLWFHAGNLWMKLGQSAPAVLAFRRAYELEGNPRILTNLGCAYRKLNDRERGEAALRRAVACLPDDPSSLINLGAAHVNEGDPYPGMAPLEHALALGREDAAWNLALLYLEAGRFGEGFDLYATGVGRERNLRRYSDGNTPEPVMLTPELPRAGKTLVLWAEQGIGDELMFSTLLPEARRDFGRVIAECHPRLINILRQAFPGIEFHPTRKDDWITWPIKGGVVADYKAPLGDLARLYRRTRESFRPGFPWYAQAYDAAEAAAYRSRLLALAQGRPIVGLAIRGGVMTTARTERTLRPQDIEPLFRDTNALFVGLDYEDMAGFEAAILDRYGPGRYVNLPAITIAYDYAHTAALVAALELVVTVCQSVAHLAAGMGQPTRVLTPAKVAWRYGLEEEAWYWYDHGGALLYRQTRPGGDWGPAIARVVQDINHMERRT
jgi:tetratricopeptide (TPR) repeat protein